MNGCAEKPNQALNSLLLWFKGHAEAAVAVSGGIDSLVLSAIAHRATGASMYHALSPAVPGEATARLKLYADRFGWRLELVQTGEIDDSRYSANPLERCYFCKSHLYEAIRSRTSAQIVSGANYDDLGDFRPGLRAAEERGVPHPFIELQIGKAVIRGLARLTGLESVSDLPASPCLSSRVELGVAITPEILENIELTESAIRSRHACPVVRCRYRRSGIVIEMENGFLRNLGETEKQSIRDTVLKTFGPIDVRFDEYRMGSASWARR